MTEDEPTPRPGPARRSATVVVAVLAVVALLGPSAAATSPEEARIAEHHERIREVRAELEEARERLTTDEAALAAADARLREILETVASAAQAVDRQQGAVSLARAELLTLEGQLLEQQRRSAERIAALYREARPDAVLSLLDARTVADAVRESTYRIAIGRSDRAALEGLRNLSTAVAAQRDLLIAEQQALERVLLHQEELLAEVEEIREDRALLAAASRDLVAQLEAEEAHLEAEAKELAARARAAQPVTAQPVAGVGSTPAVPSVGGFVWPAAGPVTSEFGPRWGRIHEGIDIGGGIGAPVVAARGGTVLSAGSLGGYGNLVVIGHGGGIATAYAHLSSFNVGQGQAVGTGQPIGAIGCSGSCTGPHLHFEVRVGGVPQNPRRYLP